jgi:hypothetical protein
MKVELSPTLIGGAVILSVLLLVVAFFLMVSGQATEGAAVGAAAVAATVGAARAAAKGQAAHAAAELEENERRIAEAKRRLFDVPGEVGSQPLDDKLAELGRLEREEDEA